MFICYFIVMMVCINTGNSLGSTKNQSPSEERYNFFDAELLQVFNEKENANLLISPLSVKLVLGMMMEGATGKGEKEIRAALRLPEDDEAGRKEFNTWLSMVQVKDSPNTLKIANRMFLSNRYSVNPDFGKTLKRYYSGGVTDVKFEDAKEATKIINNWVGNQTSQLIPSIVEENQITPDNKLVLASAVYFKGFWSTPFAMERSAVRCFYLKGNKCKDSLMMMDTGYFDYGYISRLDAQAIVLPYKGGRFSMLLLLPTSRDGVDRLGRDLVHVSVKSILSEMEKQEVFIRIPRFEVSYNEDLVENLKRIRITQVFGENANFSRIFTKDQNSTFVSHIFHSAKVTVNEEGTEAAAATGALFVPLMGGTTTSFIANHPFLFFILEPTKPLILFAGKVVSPQLPPESKISRPNSDSHEQLSKKSFIKENTIAPSVSQIHGTIQSQSNISSTNNSKDVKTNQRGQSGPKFRSIKPTFTVPRVPSVDKEYASDSYLHIPVRKTPVSRPANYYEKRQQERFFEPFIPNASGEKIKKRGKTNQELFKARKWQDPPTEDWRHHVLLFT